MDDHDDAIRRRSGVVHDLVDVLYYVMIMTRHEEYDKERGSFIRHAQLWMSATRVLKRG